MIRIVHQTKNVKFLVSEFIFQQRTFSYFSQNIQLVLLSFLPENVTSLDIL